MKKWTQNVVEVCNGFLIFSGLFCTIVRQLYENDMEIFCRSLLFIPLMLLVSLGAHKAKHFWQYAIASAAAILLAYVGAGNLLERVFLLVFTVFMVLSYFVARAKDRDCWLEKPEFAFLALFLGMYFMARRADSEFLRLYACYGAGIYYLLISYYTNTIEMYQFVQTHANLERFPEKRLLKSNRRMMWMQTGIVVAGMFVAPFVGIDQIVYGIGRVLRNILAFLLSGFENEPMPEIVQEAEQQSEMMLPGEAREISKWMEILIKVLDIIAWILVIAFIAYLLYRVAKKLYEMYLDFGTHTEENGDKVERILVVSSKERKMDVEKTKKENLFWDRSPNARIRKFYKKRVQKDIKEPINPAWTPREIEQAVQMSENEKEILHQYYEKARYGKESCTKEEMQEVLNIR